MKKIKEFIGLIKTLLSNKKTRALTILFLYFIFFFFVILMIRSSDDVQYSTPENPSTPEGPIIEEPIDDENALEKYFKITSYKYESIIKYTSLEDYEIVINGYVGESYNDFIYNGNIYNTNIVTSIENLDLLFLKFTPININDMINNGTLIDKREIDDVIIYTYKVDTKDTILNDKESEINIEIYESDNEVDMVFIDLTNYKSDYLKYEIIINYKY